MLKISFRRQVLTGFVISFLLVLGISIYSYESIINLETDKFQVEHTEQVINVSDALLKHLINAETGQRGFIITGADRFLEPYNDSRGQVRPGIKRLHSLLADNAAQQVNVDSLENFSERKLREMEYVIDLYRTRGFTVAQQRIATGTGKFYMDQCRVYLNRIVSKESGLLSQRRIKSASSIYASLQAIVIGALLFTTVICILFYVIQRFILKQKLFERRIIDANSELEKVLAENEHRNWVLTGLGKVNEVTQGEQGEDEMAAQVLRTIGNYTDALLGTFYIYDKDAGRLGLKATYAVANDGAVRKTIEPGETWMGQTITEGRVMELKGPVHPDLRFESTVIWGEVAKTYIVPFFFQRKLIGAMEVAYPEKHHTPVKPFLEQISQSIGESIHTAQSRTVLQLLLEQTQQQAEELATQQEELRTTNEELIYKTEMLQASEEELRVQQNELTDTNAQLAEKARMLEERNMVIEEARADVARKMDELEKTGRYKSEFLANMSHELRTPLNSILVLARILKDNQKQNLNTDQVKYADVIFKAGTDLLTLINDILDLTKIEAGKIDLEIEPVSVDLICADMKNLFSEIASQRNITFRTEHPGDLKVIRTDRLRLEQILKNLLSNAFKFTQEGGQVDLVFAENDEGVRISVKDTGIGIAPEKQRMVFEAFQQADGSTSRKYGGTGLGLAISRELAILLNGSLSVESTEGEGSTFTLFLSQNEQEEPEAVQKQEPVQEDPQIRMPLPAVEKSSGQKPLLLIVEDDEQFASILSNYAREQGFRTAVLHNGNQVTDKVHELMPAAIALDIMLPGKDGWQILRELKKDDRLAAIPVHLMSAGDATEIKAQKAGALSFLKKPVTKERLDELFGMIQPGINDKKLLLVEDHEVQSSVLRTLFEEKGIAVEQAFTGAQALDLLAQKSFSCVILDLNLPDIAGADLLDKIKADERFRSLPVIINTAMELDKETQDKLARYANATILKSNKSSDRLIDEVNLFLHRVKSDDKKAPATADTISANAEQVPATGRESLRNKRVLLVDDDMRNIFAISTALQQFDMQIEIANDGVEALDKLRAQKRFDCVLMDMMMPRMDGYECMQKIREIPEFRNLPVLALTAKAMKGDRERCIEAGASDYITKPVNMDVLVNLLQVWTSS